VKIISKRSIDKKKTKNTVFETEKPSEND